MLYAQACVAVMYVCVRVLEAVDWAGGNPVWNPVAVLRSEGRRRDQQFLPSLHDGCVLCTYMHAFN